MVPYLVKAKAILSGDKFNGGVALASVLSSAWLPDLAQISHIAAQLMPICGVGWLVIQGYVKINEYLRNRRRQE